MRLTLETLSLGDSDAVDHFVLGEDLLHGHLLLEVLTGKVNLEQKRKKLETSFLSTAY